MRFFRIFGAPVLLVAGAAFLAPGAAFAQSNSFEETSCTAVNSYAQFCEWFVGQSYLSVTPSTGAMSTNAVTSAERGFLINQTACESESNGNPNACKPPFIPMMNVAVSTQVGNATGSASNNCNGGFGCAQLALPSQGNHIQATDAGTYTEYSTHSATFNPPGDGCYSPTEAQADFAPYITGISPSQVGAQNLSATFTLTGVGLGPQPTVSVAGVGTLAGSGSDTSITFTFEPDDAGVAAGTYQVTVTANGLTSNNTQLSVVCATPTNFQQGASVCLPSGELDFPYTFSSSTGNTADIAGCMIAEVVNYAPFPPPSPPWPAATGYVQGTVNGGSPATGTIYWDRNEPPEGSFVPPYSNSQLNAVQSFGYVCGCQDNGASQGFPGYTNIPVTRLVSNQGGPWAYVIQKPGGACGFSLPPH